MNSLRSIANLCDAVNAVIGKAVAWLTVVMVTTQFVVVVMRYVFGVGSIHMQQSIVYMHATIFMVAAGYALQRDVHVRIDIVFSKLTERGKALVNLLGSLIILLPLTVVIWIYSWNYIVRSWSVFEGTAEGVGLPGIFIVKTLILVYATLLAFQGISLAVRSLFDVLDVEVRAKT